MASAGDMNQAELQYAAQDAYDTLKIATKDNRWADVAKYAKQIEEFVAIHQRTYGYGIAYMEHMTTYG